MIDFKCDKSTILIEKGTDSPLLKNAGLLQSKSRSEGGYSLSRLPKEITLAHVIRIIGSPLAPLGCVSKWASVKCPLQGNCGLQMVCKSEECYC